MTFNQTSSIRFSVEESVWFKKGQEVSDVVSMSLDPEISVQEHDNYISIRGSLVLSGEYHPHAGEQEDENIFSLRDTAIYRTVDEVVENEGNIHSMKHRFPIDITIPANRIRSLDDVYVLIEAFDYEIPERGRLELKADLCISGITNERESSAAERKQDTNAQNALNEQQASEDYNVNDIGLVEAERQVEVPIANQYEANNGSLVASYEREFENSAEYKFPSFSTEVRKEDIVEENAADLRDEVTGEVEVNQNFEDVLEDRLAETEAEVIDEPELEVPVNIFPKKLSPNIGMKGRSEQTEQGWNPKNLYSPQQTTYNTFGTKEVVEDKETAAETINRSKRTENALYLTKMLASGGEEDFSKLRLRIVQSGETVGTIAETYDISVNQIIRLNGLNDEILKEGQILYIPEYAGVEK
ncbi:MAG TPA: stage VI sporulation protein D [Bacillus bacterium]|nr:stage VI sporulation protein D [Bacillus sp. (in: firmicutes)]